MQISDPFVAGRRVTGHMRPVGDIGIEAQYVFAPQPAFRQKSVDRPKAQSRLGFRIVRGGAAQGILEAVSGVQAEDSLHSSRQVTAKVRLSKALEGGTELRVQMTEVLEDESTGGAGMGTQTPLRGTSLYAVFLRGVSQALGLPQKD